MDTGVNFNASDLLATQAMTGNRGVSGGAWGGGGYGTAPFAGPTSNAVRIEAGNAANAAGIENLLDQNQFAATNKNIVDGHTRVCDKLTDSEFRTSDRLRDQDRQIADNAAASVARDHATDIKLLECCCESKLLAKDAAILAINIEARGNLDKLSEARAALATAATAANSAKLDALLAKLPC